ncbi:MAG: YtfJ family protein [Halioglobus sp.]|nr:YtfJ family protein [Halioglobus sp.]
MAFPRLISSFAAILFCANALADAPTVDAPLPVLAISERGELTLTDDEFSFIPWTSEGADLGKVHVIQYFGANLKNKDTFKPFTDLLQTSFEPGTISVTTILNLDAAMWGTTGMVMSELEKNKRMLPEASMIVDEDGIGVTDWNLGDAGTGLIILDEKGIVKYFSRQALSEAEMASTIQLMRNTMTK